MASKTSLEFNPTSSHKTPASTIADVTTELTDTCFLSEAHDYDNVFFGEEKEYSFMFTKNHVRRYLRELHDSIWWNSIMCVSVLVAVVVVMMEDYHQPQPGIPLIHAAINIMYALYLLEIAYMFYTGDNKMTVNELVAFCVDLLSFSHYLVNAQRTITLLIYGSRFHRAFKYVLYINDYNVKSSILGTFFRISYMNSVLRVFWTIIWMYAHKLFGKRGVLKDEDISLRPSLPFREMDSFSLTLKNITMSDFFKYFYAINKMFIPLGTTADLSSDFERVLCVLVMVSGCLVLTGAAVAAMSLVFCIHLTPEETFRKRYQLIIKELEHSKVDPALQHKVQTFYKMYWQKQNAVSTAELLSNLPPSLAFAINYDIYFKAIQKSKILRNLPNYFLSEVAKVMTTRHYIPGDTIIKRGARKSSMYYITYGDIEMLTAEDDRTAILRMARGSVAAACSGCSLAACGAARVSVRAATYCTAHELDARALWRRPATPATPARRTAHHIVWPFYEHLERVKAHYARRPHPEVPHLSSILHLKRGLISLKAAKDENGKLLITRPDLFLEIANSYLTRSQLENAQVDESDAVCLRQRFPCVLQPASSLLYTWHGLVAALTITVCVTHPYYLTFKESVPLDFLFFNHVVTLVYIVDMIVYLSTGASVEEGVAITFTQTAAQQMQRGWFFIDVLATIPIFEFVGKGHFAGMNKLLKLPQMFQMLKRVEDSCVYHAHVLRFCIYTLLVCILCYLVAAFKQGSSCFQFNRCEVKNFTHPPHWEEEPLNDSTIKDKITFSLYWAISLMSLTSHMDNYSFERVLHNIFILEVVLILHIFIEAIYSATIMVTSAMRQKFDMYIHTVKEFLTHNSVDPILRQRFITYLELRWLTDQAYSITHEKSSIFYDLPPHVSQDIIAKQCSSFILTLPFMKFLREEDLKSISYRSNLFFTSPSEIILNTGSISDGLYVIKKGICEVLCPLTKKRVAILSTNSHFGILDCFLGFPAYYTYQALTHVEIISVKRKFLVELNVLEIPQLKDALEAVKNQPEYDRIRQHQHRPFAVFLPPPPPPNRQVFEQRRKYESDAEFLEPFSRIGLLSILRYVFPRFTLRPDGAHVARCECARAAAALLAAVLLPARCYLRPHCPAVAALLTLLDFTAYFDLIQRMLIGYYNDKGILVYHPASTSSHYLRGAFIVDLIACLPLEEMEPQIKHGEVFTMSPLRQFLTLNRLIQLYRFFYIIDTLKIYLRKDIMLVLKALPLFTTMCNVLTLCIVMSSVQITYVENADRSYNYTISTNNDTGGNWIHIFKDSYRFNITENLWNLHLATYFWVIYETTTTGYNTINPTNYRIMEILFVGMITSSMITTYFSVRVISERANIDKALCTFQEHKRDMHNFMEREMLDVTLKKRVYDHYDFNWDNTGGMETRSLLRLCDQLSLRTDIFLDMYGQAFVECPILTESDMSLLRVVARGLRDAHLARGSPVLARDDVIHHMYLVNKGVVSLRVHRHNTTTTYRLGRGSVFGNLERDEIRSPHSAVARTNVHLLQMKSKVFHEIINNFPAVVELVAKHRPHGEMYVISASKNIHYVKNPKKHISATLVSDVVKRKYNFEIPHLNKIFTAVTYLGLVVELFNIGFQNNQSLILTLLYALDVVSLMKIIALLHVPNVKKKRELFTLKYRYLMSIYFKVDVLSCLPIEIFSLVVPWDQWHAYSWLRINRLLRIVTLYKYMVRKRKRLSMNLALSTLFSVFVWFSLFVHAVSCLFYYIGTREDLKQPSSSWKYNKDGSMVCNNHYVCAVFFIVSSFVHNGVGDIMPRTHSEVILVALLAILSTMVLMIYVGEFSNIVQYHSFRSFNFYSSHLQLQMYLKNNRVSEHLISVIKKYCLHLWQESRGQQLPHFLTTAPQPLRLQIMSAAYLHHLDQHPVFKNCEPAFLRQLAGCFTLYTYNDEMKIVQENEVTDAMYFIHKGSVLEYTELNPSIRVFARNSCFGEFQGLYRDKPFECSYRSINNSQILMLYLKDWEYLLKHFPNSKAMIYDGKFSDGKDGDKSADENSETLLFHRFKSRKALNAYRVTRSMLTDETSEQFKSKHDINDISVKKENKTVSIEKPNIENTKSQSTVKRKGINHAFPTYISSDEDSISSDPVMPNYALHAPVDTDAITEVPTPDAFEFPDDVLQEVNVLSTEVSPKSSSKDSYVDALSSTQLNLPESFIVITESVLSNSNSINGTDKNKTVVENNTNTVEEKKAAFNNIIKDGIDTDLSNIESEMELGTVSVTSISQPNEIAQDTPNNDTLTRKGTNDTKTHYINTNLPVKTRSIALVNNEDTESQPESTVPSDEAGTSHPRATDEASKETSEVIKKENENKK